MPFHLRPRRLAKAALTVALVAFVAACAQDHPESIFHGRTEVNREVDFLFKILIYAGTAVFIFVEGILVWTLIKYRKRPGQPEPEHVHGNTTLEIAWTVIPAVILIIIAIPTVKTIFTTQAKARSDALQVEVIGHQWWWEFRYPQYSVVTANELYLPIGRTVNFTLKSQDVIHSFWVPALSGKRDLMANRTNYLWYTPDSASANAWNGTCVEYCGASHANMRFKAFTVSQADFESWATHQATPAAGVPVPSTQTAAVAAPAATIGPTPSAGPPGAGVPKPTDAAAAAAQAPQPVVQTGFVSFPRERIPAHAIPKTPLPTTLRFDDNLLAAGNADNGAKLIGACAACHTVKGNPMMVGVIGPNLTHVATRTTIAAGLYPNDPQHLARWIKNAAVMKPGVAMLTFGANEYDPVRKMVMKPGLTDAQIADVVAYLQTLK